MGEAIRRRTVASETGVELAPRVAKHRVGKIVAVEDVDGLMDLPSADASRWPVLVRVLEATRTEFAIKGWPRPRIRVGADGAPVIVSERWKGDFDHRRSAHGGIQ